MLAIRSVLMSLLLLTAGLPVQVAAATAFFDQTFGDFTEELATAADEGKQGILLMFEMDECPFCHRMKTTVLNQPEVEAYFREHFLIFAIDIEGDIEVVDFDGTPTTMKALAAQQYRVRATPVFLFVGLDGQPMPRGRYTGATRNAEEFLLLGRYFVEGHNTQESFTRFKRRQADG